MSSLITKLKPQLRGNAQGILGWLLPDEGERLTTLARDQVVLELGTYQGLSTLYLASSARHVHTVDHHQGDSGTGAQDSLANCRQNLQLAGMDRKVTLHVGSFADVLPYLPDGSFDLVYIDGEHTPAALRADLTHALRLVKPGGTIALHDWLYTAVQAVCRELFGREPDGTCETLSWYHLPLTASAVELPAVRRRHVFIGLPHYGGMVPQALEGLIFATTAPRYTLQHSGGSLLAMVFNNLWATALNTKNQQQWTHFAMSHADIEATAGWCDVLMDEMDAQGADVLSCVVAIKDGRGLTSTGIRAACGDIRRLTLHEVHQLPVTFTAADVIDLWLRQKSPIPPAFLDKEACRLAVNTGLWVCRFDAPWVEEFPGFTIADRLHKHDNGLWRAHVLPEDWNFSRWANAKGLRVLATRKIKVLHHGSSRFPNDVAFGEWLTDAGDN